MKTREDVEKLKRDWEEDPCFDLETAAGFEEYYGELIEYQKSTKDRWKKRIHASMMITAREWGILQDGIVDAVVFAQKIGRLVDRVDRLEDYVIHMED